VLDGVFVGDGDGALRFHPAEPPTDADVARVVARVPRRLARLGFVAADDAEADVDPVAEASEALAGLARAAIASSWPSTCSKQGGARRTCGGCGNEPPAQSHRGQALSPVHGVGGVAGTTLVGLRPDGRAGA
jgi:hypothetical protein